MLIGGGTPEGEDTHGFQIWVNVPKEEKMADPRYVT
jgi:redox-sensitive bicupin YhaK (pirin superfamily)